jgi:hypothetical protein
MALILKRGSASRTSGEWREDDYDVLADGVVVGRIMKADAAPQKPAFRALAEAGATSGRPGRKPRPAGFLLANGWTCCGVPGITY